MVKNTELIAVYKLEHNIPLETELLTYGAWKDKGYQVKRGERCLHRVTLWKHKEKTVIKDGQELKSGYCFGKMCYLFTREQVEEIKK